MSLRTIGLCWAVVSLLICGCHSGPFDDYVGDDLTVVGDASVGGILTVDHINAGSITVTGHIEADSAGIGGVIIEDGDVDAPGTVTGGSIVDLPNEPDDDDDDGEPATLMSSLRSVSGSDHFAVGEDVKMIFTFSGGVAPYDSRCLIVDGTFATEEDSTDDSFTFKERASLKVINMPGAGVITCRVTSADGQEVSSSFTVYVGVE